MEKLSRQVQLEILRGLAARYPGECKASDLGYVAGEPVWNVNAFYLAEQDLIAARSLQMLEALTPVVHSAKITARGIDFLQDDGGLGAILNVVTVKFEADTLRALVQARVDASDAPPEEKSAIKKKLGEMSSEALKELTKRLVTEGMSHWPAALELLKQTF